MQKGQIFSLDFLISLVAVIAAIGLMIHSVELNAYNQKEQRLFDELKAVAETTADLIIASNETTCADAAGEYLVNCIDSTGLTTVIDSIVPTGYDYKVKGGAIDLSRGDVGNSDFYEVKRTVIIGLAGSQEELSVKVWKQ